MAFLIDTRMMTGDGWTPVGFREDLDSDSPVHPDHFPAIYQDILDECAPHGALVAMLCEEAPCVPVVARDPDSQPVMTSLTTCDAALEVFEEGFGVENWSLDCPGGKRIFEVVNPLMQREAVVEEDRTASLLRTITRVATQYTPNELCGGSPK